MILTDTSQGNGDLGSHLPTLSVFMPARQASHAVTGFQ